MLRLPLIVLAVSALGIGALITVISVRRPLTVPFALYAGTMTFGSAIAVPGVPAPFNTLSTFLGLVTAAAIIGNLLLSSRRPNAVHRSIAPFALLVGWAALTTYWSLDPERTFRSVSYLAAAIVLYGLALALPAEDRDLLVIERAVVIGGAIAAAYGFWQLSTGEIGGGSVLPRFGVVGTAADPNATAASLLLPLLIAMGRAGAARSVVERSLFMSAAFAIAIALVLSGSRGGIVGALAALIVLGVVAPNRRRYLALAVATLVAAGIGLAFAPAPVTQHLGEQHSTGRVQIWEAGVSACATYCAIGSGYGTFGDVYLESLTRDPTLPGHRLRPFRAHNIVLGQLVELGVVGLAFTVFALRGLFGTTWRLPRRWRGPPLGALVGLLVSNMFLSHFEFRYFWLVLTYVALVGRAHLPDPIVNGRVDAHEDPHTRVKETDGRRAHSEHVPTAGLSSLPAARPRAPRRAMAAMSVAALIVGAAFLIRDVAEPDYLGETLLAAVTTEVHSDQVARMAPALLDMNSVREAVARTIDIGSPAVAGTVHELVAVEPVLGAPAFRVVSQHPDATIAAEAATAVSLAMRQEALSVGLGRFHSWEVAVSPRPALDRWSLHRLLAAAIAFTALAFGMWHAARTHGTASRERVGGEILGSVDATSSTRGRSAS